MIWAQNIKDVTLRQIGTGVSNLNEIAEKVKEDLGFNLTMTALIPTAQRSALPPNRAALTTLQILNISPARKFGFPGICKRWMPVNWTIMTRSHKPSDLENSPPPALIVQGTAPHTVGFVEGPNGKSFADHESGWMTMVPTIYNADTLGIRPDLIGRPIESWSELLNPEFKGKASILDISSIGIMDMAMVCEAMGEITYGDKGNMTKEEIDKTIAIFTEAKKNGQFRAFWKTFDESVNLMASGEVVDPIYVVTGHHQL